jgi:hypothetical protein
VARSGRVSVTKPVTVRSLDSACWSEWQDFNLRPPSSRTRCATRPGQPPIFLNRATLAPRCAMEPALGNECAQPAVRKLPLSY